MSIGRNNSSAYCAPVVGVKEILVDCEPVDELSDPLSSDSISVPENPSCDSDAVALGAEPDVFMLLILKKDIGSLKCSRMTLLKIS